MEKISTYIIDKNNQFLIANKPAGIAAVSTDNDQLSFTELLSAYLKHEVYPVHRIDQPVSGLMLFAMSKASFKQLSLQLKAYTIERKYLTLVNKAPEQTTGRLIHYLRKSKKSKKSFAFNKPLHHTKIAELDYQVLQKGDNYSLLSIQLKTGRNHQIRTQLSAIGSHIKGDVKYGAKRSNPDKSICLHSYTLGFKHPVTKAPIKYTLFPNEGIWAHFSDGMKKVQ